MEFLRNIAKSIAYHLGKIITYLLIALAIYFAMRSCKVNALTISNSYNSLNNDKVDVLINTFKSSDYKYYFITSTLDSNSIINSNMYYLCLSNDVSDIDTNRLLIDSCDEMYSFDGTYVLSLEDKNLVIDDSSFITNYYDSKNDVFIISILFLLVLGVWSFFIFMILYFNRPKGDGLKYETLK